MLPHELERLQKLEKQGSREGKKARRIRQRRIAEIETKLQEAGGRQRYQDASKVSTRHNRTVKYVCSVLTSLKLRPGKGEAKLNVLEIGAINTHLLDVTFLRTTAIDLNSCNHRIQQIDFFDLDPKSKYDVIVSSMVINCVPTKEQRLQMLLNINRHLNTNGHMFLILPLLVSGNRYFLIAIHLFVSRDIGFKLKHTKTTPKLAFFVKKVNVCNFSPVSNIDTIEAENNRSDVMYVKKTMLKKWGRHLKFQLQLNAASVAKVQVVILSFLDLWRHLIMNCHRNGIMLSMQSNTVCGQIDCCVQI